MPRLNLLSAALTACLALTAATAPAQATVRIHIDLATQRMHVGSSSGSWNWPVSTARDGYVNQSATLWRSDGTPLALVAGDVRSGVDFRLTADADADAERYGLAGAFDDALIDADGGVGDVLEIEVGVIAAGGEGFAEVALKVMLSDAEFRAKEGVGKPHTLRVSCVPKMTRL